MEAKKLLTEIRKHRVYILIFMLMGSGSGAIFYNYYFNYYTAVVTISISGEPVVSKSDADDFFVNISNLDNAWLTQRMLLRSNAMLNSLNKRLNLYKHYGIDSTSRFAYDRISKKIENSSEIVRLTKFDLFQISFKDKNQEFAIRAVNFISRELDNMNKKFLINKLRRKASVYKMVLNDLDIQTDKTISKINIQIKEINKIFENIKFENSILENLIPLQNNLNQLTADIKRISQKTANVSYAYQIAIKSISEDESPIINVIKKSSPQSKSTLLLFLVSGLASAFAFAIIYISALYFKIILTDDIAFIFSR